MELYPADILIHIINIIVLYILLRLILFKPVHKFLSERTDRVRNELDAAAAEGEKAKALAAEYEAALSGADAKAKEIVKNGEQTASESAERMLAEAKEKANGIIRDAAVTAEAEKKKAELELRGEIAQLATDMAGKILKREVKLQDNCAIVDEFFKNDCDDKNGKKV